MQKIIAIDCAISVGKVLEYKKDTPALAVNMMFAKNAFD
jgi:hypothetical protein